MYILTLVEYVLLVPDSIERQQGSPAGLLASYSGTGPRIESNQTKALAGLFTLEVGSTLVSAWAPGRVR